MKVEDYEYVDEDIDDDINLTDERKDEIVKKLKDQTVKGKITINKILNICKNDKEYDFAFKWTAQNNIIIRGSNITLSGELENYEYLDKLEEIKLPEPLDKEEQRNLFMKLNNMKRDGVDKESKEYQNIRNKLIEHNMRLALWTVFKEYRNEIKDFGFEEDDLTQIALESLITAVDAYDVDSGYEFSTYAVSRMRYSPSMQWRKMGNNSDQKRREWKRLQVIEEEMLKSEKRKPTDEEIKELLGISNKRLESLKNYIKIHSSESLESLEKSDSEYEEELINELLDDERIEEENRKQILNGIYVDREEDALGEHAMKTDIAAERMVANKDLNEVLDTLTEREKKVLKSIFGLEDGRPKNLEETGGEFYISGGRVYEIKAKALRKLRHPAISKKIREYSEDLGSEEWEKYDGIYENVGDRNQIVDGIKVEKYNLSEEKNKKRLIPEIDEKTIEDSNVEETEGQEIEQYQGQLEKIEKIEKYSNEQNYLNEITELLGELNGLDQMLKRTSTKIKSEKNKKQKNKELREKMIKVKGLMQR